MSFVFILLAICFVNVHSQINVTTKHFTDTVWTHELFLPNGFIVHWNSSDPEWLVTEMSAPTTGYVAIGASPNGGMVGSDIVLGWVDKNGIANLADMSAHGYVTPTVDKIQNYELISGHEKDGRTTIRFRRKWKVCNEFAADLVSGSGDSIIMIWATNPEDPEKVNGILKPKYHGESRGVKRTYLKSQASHVPFPDQVVNPDSAIKHWDVRMDKNLIEKEDDIYFCKIAKFPKMSRKHQLIGYRPLLQEGNEFSIHHIIMYECIVPGGNKTENIFEKYADTPGGRCYTPNMPPEWGQYCSSIPIIWTAGSEGNMFPSNTGNPLGEEHGGATYFMFEIHYDNPQLRSFVDSSGFRLFYTDQLREHDSSSILIGQKVSPFHVVPHNVNSFTSFGYCSEECTSQTLPKNGITVTTVLLHAHTAGKEITLRHLRNGKELAPIAVEKHYDFNYQQVRVVDPPIQILPGDELITECKYNTTGRTSPAFGGLGTRDEMCMSFIYYYPKIDLLECKTQPEFHSFLNGLGIKKVEGDILKELKMPYVPNVNNPIEYGDNPFYLKNSTYENPLNALDALAIVEGDKSSSVSSVGQLIRTMDWAKNGNSVEKAWNEGDHYAFCTGGSQKRFPLKNYILKLPTYEGYVHEKDTGCDDNKNNK